MSTRDPDKVFDELLVMQYGTGDKKALELLIKRWNKRIVIYAFRNTQNMEVAKDIAQEVWLIAIKNMAQVKNPSKIGSWLLSIAHYKSIDWIRQNRRVQADYSKIVEAPAVENTDHENQMIIMRRAMQELSEDHRNILTLFYLEGFSISEIAQITQLSRGTIKSRLFYARESLKKKIKNYNYE